MQNGCVYRALAASLAVVAPAAVSLGQTLDVGLFIERFDNGFFEAELTVDASAPFITAVTLDPGPEQVSFTPDSDTEFFFRVPVEPGSTLEDFLLDDEGFVDLAFALAGGGVSVYRFTVSDVFGPQIDENALPGFASGITLDVPIAGEPSVSWTAPAGPLGSFLVVEGDDLETGDAVFLETSPLPFTLMGVPAPSVASVNETSVSLSESQIAEPLDVRIVYGSVLGSLNLQRISGPALSFSFEEAVFLSSAGREFAPCRDADNASPFGIIDARDVIGAIDAAASGELGDLDGSGTLDFFDVLLALSELDEGC